MSAELDIVAFADGDVDRIRRVRDRLYSERTLNADDMRDLADQLRISLVRGVALSSDDLNPHAERGARRATATLEELYTIGERHGKTRAEVDAFLAS